MSTKENDSMMYLYKKDKVKGTKEISIAAVQAKTKYQIAQDYKEARKSRKMTQIEMSEITGVPQPNITRFESGKSNPTLEMMIKMAAAMGMELEISFKEMKNKN